MDLVDVLRIALRRWYVVLAILVVGSVAALVLASSVEPTYKVSSESILISGQTAQDPERPATGPTNPYMQFSSSLFTTLSAVTRTVNGDEYRKELVGGDASRDYTFGTSQEAPVIITEAESSTPEDALALAQSVQAALSETLSNIQADEEVPPEEQIFMRVLTTSDATQEMGSRNRVLVGVFAITLAAAIGGAVLVESLVQTRKRPRGGDREDQAGSNADDPATAAAGDRQRNGATEKDSTDRSHDEASADDDNAPESGGQSRHGQSSREALKAERLGRSTAGRNAPREPFPVKPVSGSQ